MLLTDLLVAALLLLIGGYLIRIAAKNARELVHLLVAQPPDDATIGSYVRVSARPKAIKETVQAPLSSESCVGYALVTEGRYRSRLLTQWHHDYVTWNVPPFELTYSGQVVRVQPRQTARATTEPTLLSDAYPGSRYSNILLSLDDRSQRYEPIDAPPECIVDVVDRTVETRDHPYRYSEYRVDQDTNVLVVGQLRAGPDGRLAIVNDEDGTFLLLERGYWSTLWVLVSRIAVWLAISLVFLAPAVLYLFVTLR